MDLAGLFSIIVFGPLAECAGISVLSAIELRDRVPLLIGRMGSRPMKRSGPLRNEIPKPPAGRSETIRPACRAAQRPCSGLGIPEPEQAAHNKPVARPSIRPTAEGGAPIPVWPRFSYASAAGRSPPGARRRLRPAVPP